MPTPTEALFVLAIVLIVFGWTRLSSAGDALGRACRTVLGRSKKIPTSEPSKPPKPSV